MPPKPALPSDDMISRHERAVQIETQVRGLLHHGALRQAARVFDSGWEGTLLHHLPLRYPFLLEHPDRVGVKRFLSLVTEGRSDLRFRLLPGVDRHHPDRVGVGLAGEDHLLGFLPLDVLDVLDGAGEHQDLYEPKILAVRDPQSGSPVFEMEIARPDLRQCSACTALHTGDHENCDDCRAKRRRKKKTLEETAEAPVVPTVTAFKHLSEAHEGR